MPTSIASNEVRDIALTQLMAVAAVLAAFPATTLVTSGSNQRYRTALATLQATPANAQIVDEQGDLLSVHFLTANPNFSYRTTKGQKRFDQELNQAPATSF